MNCQFETTFTVGPCGGWVRLTTGFGLVQFVGPSGPTTPVPPGKGTLSTEWTEFAPGDYTFCLPDNCPTKVEPAVEVIDKTDCAAAAEPEPEPEPIPQIDVETVSYCDVGTETHWTTTTIYTDGVAGAPASADTGIPCVPEDPPVPLDFEKVRECRDGFINIVVCAFDEDGNKKEISVTPTEEPCGPVEVIDVEIDMECIDNEWTLVTVTFTDGVETDRKREGLGVKCDLPKPDTEIVRECRDGAVWIVTYSIINGVQSELGAIETKEACNVEVPTATLVPCADGGNLWTWLSKYDSDWPEVAASGVVKVGNVNAGEPNYGNWTVYAYCGPTFPTFSQQVMDSSTAGVLGDPTTTVTSAFSVAWTRGAANPTCEGGGDAQLVKHCGPITVQGSVLDAMLEALNAIQISNESMLTAINELNVNISNVLGDGTEGCIFCDDTPAGDAAACASWKLGSSFTSTAAGSATHGADLYDTNGPLPSNWSGTFTVTDSNGDTHVFTSGQTITGLASGPVQGVTYTGSFQYSPNDDGEFVQCQATDKPISANFTVQ